MLLLSRKPPLGLRLLLRHRLPPPSRPPQLDSPRSYGGPLDPKGARPRGSTQVTGSSKETQSTRTLGRREEDASARSARGAPTSGQTATGGDASLRTRRTLDVRKQPAMKALTRFSRESDDQDGDADVRP